MRHCATVVGLALLVVTAAVAEEPAGGPACSAPPPGLSLTGYWRLDPKLSDHPGQKGSETTKGQQSDRPPRRPPLNPGVGGIPDDGQPGVVPTGPGVDVMTPGMTGPPNTGDPFERRPSGSSASQSRSSLEHILADLPETLTIAQRLTLILIQEDDDEGRTRALVPDGARHRATGGESETLTCWESSLLRVKTWHDDGVRVEEIFELAPDGATLTVTVRVDDGSNPIALERVFRPENPEAG